ncbi:Hint domain-containing protein [Acidisphaera sp. S103]|uniref:Hint domain-containing protein n=1 Tax=Acidisphaera sp. S103 TaxID=1747223 RepID=UPI00131AA6C3|nr:Hint domain-containing protein [Acidisphaera sp. S103]
MFEIPKNASGYATTPTTLAAFTNFMTGVTPESGVIADSSGNSFGTLSTGTTGGAVFELSGTDFQPLCFLVETLIATPAGEVPVERLAAGDLVQTFGGKAREIVWVGRGEVLVTRGRRGAATPVIIRKGALATNVPHRDLKVTKAHSLYIDGALIPVEFLVNHRSILWDDHAQQVTLFHVELETHDILLANGAPAETYRDDGNRWLFQNANTGWGLPPQRPFAPVSTGGPLVDRVWRHLLDRSGPRPSLPLTDDPGLHLLVDGARLKAAWQDGTVHVFPLAHRPAVVRIVSRVAIPAELGVARDPRMLGVGLRRVIVRKGTQFQEMKAADATLADEFHPFEADCDLRWADGDALLPQALFEGFDGVMELVLHLGGTTQYPLVDEPGLTAAA